MKKSARRAGGDRRLAEMHEFGGALAEHLTAEHPRRAALAEQRQEPCGLAGDVRARHFAEVGAADDHDRFSSQLASLCDSPTQAISGMVYTPLGTRLVTAGGGSPKAASAARRP